MLSPRFLYPVTFGLFFFVLGIMLRNWNLMIIAIPLCVSALILPFLGSVEPELEIERHVSAVRVIEGGAVTVTVTIKNVGDTIEHLRVEDQLVDMSSVTNGVRGWFGRLKKGECVGYSYDLDFSEPGKYKLAPILVFASSLLSFKKSKMLEN